MAVMIECTLLLHALFEAIHECFEGALLAFPTRSVQASVDRVKTIGGDRAMYFSRQCSMSPEL